MPLATSFAKTAEDRQVMEVIYSQNLFGRPYVLPEGVPAERVAALRKAFMATMSDPALIAEANKAGMELGERRRRRGAGAGGKALWAAGERDRTDEEGDDLQGAKIS